MNDYSDYRIRINIKSGIRIRIKSFWIRHTATMILYIGKVSCSSSLRLFVGLCGSEASKILALLLALLAKDFLLLDFFTVKGVPGTLPPELPPGLGVYC